MQKQKSFLPESRIDFFLLLLIVSIGAVLRFIYFNHCPFTHDEISSLERANYSSFSELIEKGVKPDTHPPLLQIFLQYYTRIFGTSEMVVKFPFVLCGILSIVLVYLIAAKWFGNTTALLSAAVVSTAQYTVMYSVIARHYSLGLFLTLLLVFFQNKYFETEGRKKIRWLAAFTITGIACAYTHYFCLLFTAIVVLTGFLFVTRKNVLQYFIACALIPLLFLPYLPVFLIQLSYKGIGGPDGWLGKPDSSFFLQYIRYIFHYSNKLLVLMIAVFSFGFVRCIIRNEKTISKNKLICLAWFLIPMLTGYFYSVKVNPILQFSILIFSFPYLLMVLFSFIRIVKPLLKVSLVILILFLNTLTLVYSRNHYELFYNQGINKITQEINSAGQKFGKDSVDAIVDVEDYFLAYYKSKYPSVPNAEFISLNHPLTISDFQGKVSQSRKNYFVFASVKIYPLECVQILKKYFPHVVSEYKGHLTEIYCCSKLPITTAADDKIIFASENNFTGKPSGWNYDDKKVFADSVSDERYFRYETSDEYGVEFYLQLDGLIKSRTNIINVSIDAMITDTESSPLLVMTMERDGKSLDWRATKFFDYLKPNEEGKVFLSVRFSDIHISTKNVTLKVYVWNKGHASFRLSNLKVSSKKGNPSFYGLFEEF